MVDLPNHKPVELKVTNFGPITKAEVQLRPLTVFIGPSGTGKSYLVGSEKAYLGKRKTKKRLFS